MLPKTTERFRKSFKKLPLDIQQKARKSFNLWQENIQHKSLKFKKIHKEKEIYSIRITLGYRAVGVIDKKEMIWFWIGSHSNYDKLIKNL